MPTHQENGMGLKRSVSFAGVTNHSRRLRQNRQKNGHALGKHPYRKHRLNGKANGRMTTNFPKNRGLSESEKDRLRIIDADFRLKENAKSIVNIAHQFSESLSFNNDSFTFLNSNDYQSRDDILQRDSLPQTNQCTKNTADPLTRQFKDISNQQANSCHTKSDNEGGDEFISIPCFGDEFLQSIRDSNEENRRQTCQEAKENDGKAAKSESQELSFFKSTTKPCSDVMLQCYTHDNDPYMFDTGSSDVICVECSNYLKSIFKECEVEEKRMSNDVHLDRDFCDMLCVESPAKEPEAPHKANCEDFYQALTLHEDYTCQMCGSNLEIEPFDGLLMMPRYNDFNHGLFDLDQYDDNYLTSSYSPSQCADINMFCPNCCESRLVQNYNVK